MPRIPCPTPFVLVCAAMLALPLALLLVCLFLALYTMAGDPAEAAQFSGPAWLGAVIIPVPATLLLLAEYRSIVCRDARATGCITGFCFWFLACGSIGWIGGVLSLTGVVHSDHNWESWAEFGVYTAMLAILAFVGIGHLRWSNMLEDAKGPETTERDL